MASAESDRRNRLLELDWEGAGLNPLRMPGKPGLEWLGAIYFTPAPHLRDPLMASAPSGWYIDLVFDEGKYLIRYSLSNLHK